MPTPLDVASLALSRRIPRDANEMFTLLQKNFAEVLRTAESVGLDTAAALEGWMGLRGPREVALWCSRETSDGAVVSEWIQTVASSSGQPGLLECLVQEEQLCSRSTSLGAYLRSSGKSYAQELLRVRRRTAKALLANAYEVPFHRPVLLHRALNLARFYLASLLSEDLDSESGIREHGRIRGDLGKVLVTAARFSRPEVKELLRARDMLKQASAETIVGRELLESHLLEACLQLWHATGEKEHLVQGVDAVRASNVTDDDWPSWHLNAAELWMALSSEAQTITARAQFLARSKTALDVVDGLQPDLSVEIRYRMLKALWHFMTVQSARVAIDIRGMRFPFGLRSSPEQQPQAFFDCADDLMEALQSAAERGQYSYRDVLSEVMSYVARNAPARPDKTLLLEEAIRFREPIKAKQRLTGMRASIAQSDDYFLLYKLTRGERFRVLGIRVLLRQIDETGESAEPFVLLATQIEEAGPIVDPSFIGEQDLLSALRKGDAASLYQMAARRALVSLDLRRRGLGGRGGVATLEDYSGATGQSFVFKEMTHLALARDKATGAAISEALGSLRLDSRFGVIEHLMETNLPGSAEAADEDRIMSVRRYVNGRTLRALIQEDRPFGLQALANSVEYLALFHGRVRSGGDISKVRKAVREQELGRWLKKILPEGERKEALDEWFTVMDSVPNVPRRDAHSLNWLVDSRGRVLAVDLEATGWRPAFYELAQLVDDEPVYAPGAWDARRELFDAYRLSLQGHGIDIPREQAWRAYLGATAARAASLLSDPNTTEQSQRHGFELLRTLTQTWVPEPVRAWAQRLVGAWARKAGLVSTTSIEPMSNSDRRRISRAMAYHLRHDATAPMTRGGWIFADDLADLLSDSGHSVSPEQLLLVAGAMGEPRFQLDGSEIRAAYGHSLKVHIDYQARRPSGRLFHATPVSRIPFIFEAQAGLSPMNRRMVHLTDRHDVAQAAARRSKEPVVLLEVSTDGLDGLVFAGGNTWLAPRVRVDALTVLTGHQVAKLHQLV